jgi:hypothetical protein
LPQPTSTTTAPAGTSARKAATLGHGVCLVELKWPAMLSYTE